MPNRSQFTLAQLFVVITVIALLLAILVPALQMPRGTSRRSQCMNNLSNIAIALNDYVSKTGGRPYPNLSTTSIHIAAPGCTAPGIEAGYSWIVNILPQLDEGTLYDKITRNSDWKSKPAFGHSITATGKPLDGKDSKHLCTYPIKVLVCPSFSGDVYIYNHHFAAAAPNAESAPTSPWKDFEGIDSFDPRGYGPAISNYVAISATHLECMFSAGPKSKRTGEKPNGIFTPDGSIRDRDVTDDKTLILIESREQRYAAWYDGTVNWCVAYWPEAKNQPLRDPQATPPVPFWTVDAKSSNSASALNQGPTGRSKKPYLTAATMANVNPNFATDWEWGPSSEHNGGNLINAAYAGGETRALSADIDPNVLMHMVTRHGGEAEYRSEVLNPKAND